MNWFESQYIRWSLPAALAAAWGIRMSLGGEIVTMLENIIGLGSLLVLLTMLLWKRNELVALWDEQRGLLSVVRPLTLEISSAMLFEKIPQGIDLSYNANRVLSALGARFRDEVGGKVNFVVCRPLENGPTRVGFVVSRKRVRTIRTYHEMEATAEQVTADAQVLESAMVAAYPHTPVSGADLDSLIMMKTGGVGTVVRNT